MFCVVPKLFKIPFDEVHTAEQVMDDIMYKTVTNQFTRGEILPSRVPNEGQLKDLEPLRVPGVVDMQCCIDKVSEALVKVSKAVDIPTAIQSDMKTLREDLATDIETVTSKSTEMQKVVDKLAEDLKFIKRHVIKVQAESDSKRRKLEERKKQ